MSEDSKDTFANMGVTYQEKVVQAVLQDAMFAEQMGDVLDPKFFELKYLQEIVKKFYDHKREFKTYPSSDILEIMVTKMGYGADELVSNQVRSFLGKIKEHPLNGDMGFIQASSLDFCKRQTLKEAMIRAIERMQESDYDSIQTIIKDAINKGASRDLGHDYNEGFASRCNKATRQPISTGWPTLDAAFNGGWERKTLTTFIAPTGAGKSMFLVNCGASALERGMNVLYITCEMADYKIGIRFDSYFSGVEINNVESQRDRVEQEVSAKTKGRLWIKEFATKTASVQTIRAYINRLKATQDFIPDMIIVDYAGLLRGSGRHGDLRFELEGIYEDLRALSQEENVVMITADQTNRSGLEMEVVTIAQIGESYAKATVCDVIMTVSRRAEDKQANTGRLFLAKSRLGSDGMVYPFTLNTSTVKVNILKAGEDPIALFMQNNKNLQQMASERFTKLVGSGEKKNES